MALMYDIYNNQLQQQNNEHTVIKDRRYQRVDQKVVFRSRTSDTMTKRKEDKKTNNDLQNITQKIKD